MGKRGPQRKPEGERKPNPTSLRLDHTLKDRLEIAAKSNGRTLSREIEHRLMSSLRADAMVGPENFGTPETHALMLAMARTISDIEDLTGHRWHKNRFTFGEVANCCNAWLTPFTPAGRRGAPAEFPTTIPAGFEDFKRIARQQMAAQGVGVTIAHRNMELMLRHSTVVATRFKELPAWERAFNQIAKAAHVLRPLWRKRKQPKDVGFTISEAVTEDIPEEFMK